LVAFVVVEALLLTKHFLEVIELNRGLLGILAQDFDLHVEFLFAPVKLDLTNFLLQHLW